MRLLILSHQSGSVWSAGAERARTWADWTRAAGHEPVVMTIPRRREHPIRHAEGDSAARGKRPSAGRWVEAARLAWRTRSLSPIHLVVVAEADPTLEQAARWCRQWRGWPFLSNRPTTHSDRHVASSIPSWEPTIADIVPGDGTIPIAGHFAASVGKPFTDTVDPDEFRPGAGRALFRALWNAGERFLCGVRGGDVASPSSRCLFHVAERLRHRDQGRAEYGFCVLTSAQSTAAWEDAVAERALENVRVLGPAPRAVLPGVLAACDAWLCDEPEPSRHSPRFDELAVMSANVPLLMPARGSLLDTVLDADAGLAVTPGNPDSLIDALQELAEHPHGCRSGRSYVTARHDARREAARWSDLLAAHAPPLHLPLRDRAFTPQKGVATPDIAQPTRDRDAA